MLLDINDLAKNYRLLMGAKLDSQGKPLGLAANTHGVLFPTNSSRGWWARIVGGLESEKTLRIAVEKTYRTLESVPEIALELGRLAKIEKQPSVLQISPQALDKNRIEPFISFVEQVHRFWAADTSASKELTAAAKTFERLAHWLPKVNLALACRRIAADEIKNALIAYQEQSKTPPLQQTEAKEAEETVRWNLVASQERIIEEQATAIETLKAQLAAHTPAPTVVEQKQQAVGPTPNEQMGAIQATMAGFEAAIRIELKHLDHLVTKIEERRGIVKEELPAPLTMAANMGGRAGGGSSRHDVIEQLAQVNKRLSGLIQVAADWDPAIDPAQQRIAVLEMEIDQLSDSLVTATEELARKNTAR